MGWIVALVLALIVCRTVFSFVISWLRNEKTKYDKAKSETSSNMSYERRRYEEKSNEVEQQEKKILILSKIVSCNNYDFILSICNWRTEFGNCYNIW